MCIIRAAALARAGGKETARASEEKRWTSFRRPRARVSSFSQHTHSPLCAAQFEDRRAREHPRVHRGGRDLFFLSPPCTLRNMRTLQMASYTVQ